MNANLYAPFLEATRNVFKLMLDLSDISDQPAETFACDDELDISIGVVGDLKGEVVYRFPRATSLSMVNIMSGMEMESVDDFVTSAIAEIANIISGNVLMMLAGNNLNCDILPPVLLKPDDSKDYDLRTACCLVTSVGNVCLDLRLNPAG
ncbi:chemotaxis protein CheX [Desulfosporosinus sp. PR]|uniref:chemotaxis protein CheX n=1 Tax=Candidatus Desulfosporosinus nitrosoreducens TaxID=3401928 RepID=UPI0027FDE081|nr:chemotaxis protein CheX [Desulfosporosinus sp. PR]MDQ7094643.1 chemotaxis protein CheX [Desulfosporosinus sp. PR]